MTHPEIIIKAEHYVRNLFLEGYQADHLYHDLHHTAQVAMGAQEVAIGMDLTEEEKEIVILAAWFHDIGFIQRRSGHEAISAAIAQEFLEEFGYPASMTEEVIKCILATRFDAQPNSLLEKVIKDADLLSLGKPDYPIRSKLLRRENVCLTGISMSDEEWLQEQVDFLSSHSYYTLYARETYNQGKEQNLYLRQRALKELQQQRSA